MLYRLFYAALTIFWILDITNMPFMSIFDTTYPINGLAWLLIWIFIPGVTTVVTKAKNN